MGEGILLESSFWTMKKVVCEFEKVFEALCEKSYELKSVKDWRDLRFGDCWFGS